MATKQERPLFSVVTPTFNRPAQVFDCLEALANQSLEKNRFEVILVDDGGREPLDRIVDDFRERLDIRLLRQPNGGCASARQFGIDHAAGEYLAFTDDDCRPAPDWLTRMEEVLARFPGCAIGGRTVNGANNVYAEATQFIVNFLIEATRDEAGYVRFTPTSNLVFPSEAFRAIGGLDRAWRIAGGEDRDLCARWRHAGHALLFAPSAKVLHYHWLTLEGFLKQHFHYGRGAWHYYKRSAPVAGRLELRGGYLKLFRSAFEFHSIKQALHLCGLVLAAQLASATGWISESLHHQQAPGSIETVLQCDRSLQPYAPEASEADVVKESASEVRSG